MCDWILALSTNYRIALYCSDVAGAFDKVSSERFLNKLAVLGIHRDIFQALRSWLEPRSAHVIVDNEASHHFNLQDMVYQGTVLGPPFWDLFFASCRHAVNEHDFREVVFVDDLNYYRKFHRDFSNEHIYKILNACQESVHKWGETHQVEFESSKESMHI